MINSPRPSRWTRVVAALLLTAPVLLTKIAAAQPAATLQTTLQAFIDQVGGAVVQVMRDDTTQSSADLANARELAAQLRTLAADPALVEEIGRLARKVQRIINGLDRLLARAQATVDNPTRSTSRKLKVLKVVYARGLKASAILGKPVIAEVNARTAGFHRPGDEVTFRVVGADGAPCNETPTVTVENQYFSSAVDLSTVQSHPDGTITMQMGTDSGGARVTVTACGQSSTRLLFNYGPQSPKTMPTNLPTGGYALSFSASGEVSLPETPLGTLVNTQPGIFAKVLLAALRQAAAAYTPPECATGIRYSPFDGDSFTVTFSVTCTSGEATASQTLVFRIRRL
jgi:hypothetical protein